MASYNKYDPRLESLVMETRTLWDPEVGNISAEDKVWLAEEVQKHPERAAKINYERSHTGFTREITVTLADVERIYDERMATR
ncbi:MAG TPA: hypothetical protein VMR25_23255 [Planctomycetaceae bacterium]|jgi:hypothetical protein|nr:hypothetical protein [Planctomycetaceae bacterium]